MTIDSSIKTPLGEILIRRGKINAAQLAEALERQTKAKEPKLLGEILLAMKCLEEADIIAALVLQCGVPYVAVSKYEVDPKVLKLIPENKIRSLCLMPVDKTDGVLSVVMVDPLRKDMIAEIEKITGLRVAPFIASKVEIDEAIRQHFIS
jgi:type IV pilus assembly protein PilB